MSDYAKVMHLLHIACKYSNRSALEALMADAVTWGPDDDGAALAPGPAGGVPGWAVDDGMVHFA